MILQVVHPNDPSLQKSSLLGHFCLGTFVCTPKWIFAPNESFVGIFFVAQMMEGRILGSSRYTPEVPGCNPKTVDLCPCLDAFFFEAFWGENAVKNLGGASKKQQNLRRCFTLNP